MPAHDGLVLRDPTIAPDNQVLADAMGSYFGVYTEFLARVEALGVQNVWRFYKDGTAWMAKGSVTRIGPRGGKKETPLYWMSAWEDHLLVTVYFKATDRHVALEAPVSDALLARIATVDQMGKINQIPISFHLTEPSQLDDVIALIATKRDRIR